MHHFRIDPFIEAWDSAHTVLPHRLIFFKKELMPENKRKQVRDSEQSLEQ